jgi:two-component system sensor histidine kinase PilS (NtrC family)
MIVNPAAESILGLEHGGTYKGEPIGDVIPHMPALVQELSSVLERGEPRRRYELEVRRADSGILPLGISISILKGEREEKRGVIALFQDLTEVQRMRSRVRMADKMAAIGKLSAAIAHEIRAPLASICGSIEMLSSELDVSGDNRKLMYIILKESDRLERIITDFLEFARMRHPALSALDIERCLEETLLLLKQSPAIEEKLSMRLECDVPCARVYADEEQIKQVFLNLGLNACEAMCHSGSLTISILREIQQLQEETAPVECIRVRFENDGPHIPEDVLPHIFEPFFTTKEGGTGLGLAIAARILESHGGTIRAENIDSRGTAFTVIIPAAVPKEKEKEKVFQEGFIGF